MTKKSSGRITGKQKKEFRKLVKEVTNQVLAEYEENKIGFKKLIKNGPDFKTQAVLLAREFGNQYADEEMESDCQYSKNYGGPKPIDEQIIKIADIFNLNPNQALEFAKKLPSLPVGAEGWFAIPAVDVLAKTYISAIQLVHEKIGDERLFYNHWANEMTPDCLQVHSRTEQALKLIAQEQPGDIWIIAAQLGQLHRGQSVRRSRVEFADNEYGLGSLAVGSIILTHPDLIESWDDLGIDLPGDEFSFKNDGIFSGAPAYFSSNEGLHYDVEIISIYGDGCGSASGFLSAGKLDF